MSDVVLANARLALPDRIVPHGWIAVADGRIAEFGEGIPPGRGKDMAGDLIMPGLVELHTDQLEAHYLPRPNVTWNPLAAVLAYDAEVAAAGITTVFDCFRVGTDERKLMNLDTTLLLMGKVGEAQGQGLTRVRHLAHLRCEICSDDVLTSAATILEQMPAAVISLMDHTPGQRQFRSLDLYREFFGRNSGMTSAELEDFIARRLDWSDRFSVPHRQGLVALARRHGVTLASHDDTTTEQVASAVGDGVRIAEFPVTLEAAATSHAAGIRVLMGAPNVVRGGSHSGNIAALDLAREGVLDILSSDYIPASLLLSAFQLAHEVPGIPLATALGTVTSAPAAAAGLTDRGTLAPGLLADIIRVDTRAEVPVVRSVWRSGERVM